jgi:hypothetical protein
MSLKLHNDTPFSAEIFEQLNPSGELVQCIAVRGTFRIIDDAYLELSDEQAPFLWTDEYHEDPKDAGLLQQADFIAYKPATDITVRGFTYAPHGVVQSSWLTGVRVCAADGRVIIEKVLRAHGPRSWRRIKSKDPAFGRNVNTAPPLDFALTLAEPVKRVPLQWQYSAGGQYRDGVEIRFDLRNPIGAGPPGWDGDVSRDLYPAPLFEAVEDPVSDPAQVYKPQNMAPIHPAWSERLRHAGTFDEVWKTERWPLLPQDFEYRFYNCAASDLIAEPWLEGGEFFDLLNLSPQHGKLTFCLPTVRLVVEHDTGLKKRLRLDGVHIDTEHETVALTWRTAFLDGSGLLEVYLRIARDGAAAGRPMQDAAVGQ